MPEKNQTPPPAYFLSLSLENVRSFGEKQTISFARPDGRPAQWTIILGDNGVGKTTVLKSLAGTSASYQSYKSIDKVQSQLKNPLLFRWNALRFQGEDRANISFQSCTHFNLAATKAEFNEATLGRMNFEVIRTPNQYPAVGASESTIDLSGLICYGYGAGRTVGDSTLRASKDVVEDTCITLFDDQADLLNPEEWFLRKTLSSYVNRGGTKRASIELERIRKALLQVLPDVTGVQIRSTDKDEQQLELETPYGWVRLRDMSLGYQTLVVWLTDFASKLFLRYPDSENPLEEPAIVLIDEIDLHLHPSWQRKLLGFLSGIFKNTQFIATAHSPLVVQAAGDEDANVVLLRREGDQTVVVTDVEDVRGWRVDQILTSSFYNLETARSLETEKKMNRQAFLLNKEKLSVKERRELDALTLALEGAPMGSTGGEEEEAAILRELMNRLNQSSAG